MKKIIVIGCPGSGKSTFARALRDRLGIPLYHLDMMFWNVDKTTVEKSVFLERLGAVLGEDSWIIDGNYSSTMGMRIKACDTVFFLDYQRDVCLAGVRERRGKPRDDMPWIETEDDPEFMEFINDYSEKTRPEVLKLLSEYSDKNIVIFKNRSEASEFLNQENIEKMQTKHSISDEFGEAIRVKPPVIIETERLRIREYTEGDLDALAEILTDAETMKYYPRPYGISDVKRWIDWCMASYQKYGFGLWALELRGSGEFIGDTGISIQNIDGELLPEIGYHVNRKYWRQGYAKEAAAAVKNWLFENTDYGTVYSYMNRENLPSRATAEANGMKMIKEYEDTDEVLSVYGITRSEWEKSRRKNDIGGEI